mgnify:CR=1 FL=1
MAIGTCTFTIYGEASICASFALICSGAGAGEAAWVAVRALEVGFIAAFVLVGQTGTFPFEGEQTNFTCHAFICNSAGAGLAAGFADCRHITYSIYWCVIGCAGEAVTCEWSNAGCTTCMAAVCVEQCSKLYIIPTYNSHIELLRSDAIEIFYPDRDRLQTNDSDEVLTISNCHIVVNCCVSNIM